MVNVKKSSDSIIYKYKVRNPLTNRLEYKEARWVLVKNVWEPATPFVTLLQAP